MYSVRQAIIKFYYDIAFVVYDSWLIGNSFMQLRNKKLYLDIYSINLVPRNQIARFLKSPRSEDLIRRRSVPTNSRIRCNISNKPIATTFIKISRSEFKWVALLTDTRIVNSFRSLNKRKRNCRIRNCAKLASRVHKKILNEENIHLLRFIDEELLQLLNYRKLLGSMVRICNRLWKLTRC